jgi:hypothetical protein
MIGGRKPPYLSSLPFVKMKIFLCIALFFAGFALVGVAIYNGAIALSWHGHAIAILLLSMSGYVFAYALALSHSKPAPRPWRYVTEVRRG